MAASSNDTYAGSLEVLLKQVAVMHGVADANLPFLQQLQEMIVNEIRNPERQMQQAGILPSAPANPAGLDQLGLPGAGGMSAPPPSFLGAGAPAGVQMSPQPPNPDQLQQMFNG